MEVEMSQDLQWEIWRPKGANGIVLVGVQRPENQDNQWHSFCRKARRLKSLEDLVFQF